MSLDVQGLRFGYDAPVLAGIDLQLDAGRNGFLLGPSGSGKTTLLRCIAGLEAGYQGSIQWKGTPLEGKAPHQRPVGMLFQEPALFPHLNAWQNVAFSFPYRGLPRASWRPEAEAWLEAAHYDRDPEAAVDALSGGQRQRVALARTLAATPAVVLLDEPFSALDRPLREALGEDVRRILQEQAVAALWVTHDEGEAERLGDVVWRLRDGRIDAKAP